MRAALLVHRLKRAGSCLATQICREESFTSSSIAWRRNMQRSIFDEPAVAATFAEAGVNPKHAGTIRRLALARLRAKAGACHAHRPRFRRTRVLRAPSSCHLASPCASPALAPLILRAGETTLAAVQEDEQAPGRSGERVPVGAWAALRDAGFVILSTSVAEESTSSSGAFSTHLATELRQCVVSLIWPEPPPPFSGHRQATQRSCGYR